MRRAYRDSNAWKERIPECLGHGGNNIVFALIRKRIDDPALSIQEPDRVVRVVPQLGALTEIDTPRGERIGITVVIHAAAIGVVVGDKCAA